MSVYQYPAGIFNWTLLLLSGHTISKLDANIAACSIYLHQQRNNLNILHKTCSESKLEFRANNLIKNVCARRVGIREQLVSATLLYDIIR